MDVTAVAIAMEHPYDAVARAVRTLRTQHGGPFGGVAVEDPSVYVGAHIAFLADAATELAAPNGTLLRRVQAADAQRIATAIDRTRADNGLDVSVVVGDLEIDDLSQFRAGAERLHAALGE